MKKTGFTLAELLVTIAIIGVIAAIALPQFITGMHNQSNASRLSTAITDYENIFGMMMEKENKNNIFETEFGKAWSTDNQAGMKTAMAKYTKIARSSNNNNTSSLGYISYLMNRMTPGALADEVCLIRDHLDYKRLCIGNGTCSPCERECGIYKCSQFGLLYNEDCLGSDPEAHCRDTIEANQYGMGYCKCPDKSYTVMSIQDEGMDCQPAGGTLTAGELGVLNGEGCMQSPQGISRYYCCSNSLGSCPTYKPYQVHEPYEGGNCTQLLSNGDYCCENKGNPCNANYELTPGHNNSQCVVLNTGFELQYDYQSYQCCPKCNPPSQECCSLFNQHYYYWQGQYNCWKCPPETPYGTPPNCSNCSQSKPYVYGNPTACHECPPEYPNKLSATATCNEPGCITVNNDGVHTYKCGKCSSGQHYYSLDGAPASCHKCQSSTPYLHSDGKCRRCLEALYYGSPYKSCHDCPQGQQIVNGACCNTENIYDGACHECRQEYYYGSPKTCHQCRQEYYYGSPETCHQCKINQTLHSNGKCYDCDEDHYYGFPEKCHECLQGEIEHSDGSCHPCDEAHYYGNPPSCHNCEQNEYEHTNGSCHDCDEEHFYGFPIKFCHTCKADEHEYPNNICCPIGTVLGGDTGTECVPPESSVSSTETNPTPFHKIGREPATTEDISFSYAESDAQTGANMLYSDIVTYEYTDASGKTSERRAATIYIDVNGKSWPNAFGRDVFAVVLDQDGHLYPYGSEKVAAIFRSNNRESSEDLTWKGTSPRYGCTQKGSYDGLGCTARLVEKHFKVDY